MVDTPVRPPRVRRAHSVASRQSVVASLEPAGQRNPGEGNARPGRAVEVVVLEFGRERRGGEIVVAGSQSVGVVGRGTLPVAAETGVTE